MCFMFYVFRLISFFFFPIYLVQRIASNIKTFLVFLKHFENLFQTLLQISLILAQNSYCYYNTYKLLQHIRLFTNTGNYRTQIPTFTITNIDNISTCIFFLSLPNFEISISHLTTKWPLNIKCAIYYYN